MTCDKSEFEIVDGEKRTCFFYEKHSSPPLPCVGDFNNFLKIFCLTTYWAFTSVVGRGTKVERQEAAIVCGHRGVTCVTQKRNC